MESLFDRHTSPTDIKLDDFERYVRRQQLSRFLVRYELFKMTKEVKGAVIAFDEINNSYWQGETLAMLEVLGDLNRYQVQKFPFDPNIAYIRL